MADVTHHKTLQKNNPIYVGTDQQFQMISMILDVANIVCRHIPYKGLS